MTMNPPLGAVEVRVTLQVETVPALTVAGVQLKAASATAGVTVTVAVMLTPPPVAVMVALV